MGFTLYNHYPLRNGNSPITDLINKMRVAHVPLSRDTDSAKKKMAQFLLARPSFVQKISKYF
jgi:hypothetical protein